MTEISGRLIVLEGPDGVGKTTIANALVDHYRSLGIRCVCLAFPGNEIGTLGYLVYNIHHDPKKYGIERMPSASLQLLHIAAHIDAIENMIRPILMQGHYLVLDRYWWSTWVYGLVGEADPKVISAMIEVEKLAWAEIRPSCILLIDREHSLRTDVSEDQWQKLRKAYHQLMVDEGGKYPIALVINGSRVADALEKVVNVLSDINN